MPEITAITASCMSKGKQLAVLIISMNKSKLFLNRKQ